ncbi:MAG: glycosyltransferase family 4 protein [Myxococcales bacterium]|nr:glycosyltransferase family 4 protein [Myxococcales bacterium]MCB9709518.1 glycosyltransferase family 4 protein [Myxococcales bacterium]
MQAGVSNRVLHVAALPFPSYQGTQAAIKHMLEAMSAHGYDVHLLCYPHHAYIAAFPFHIHRVASLVANESLRSGPSWRKLLQDAQLSLAIHRLCKRLNPRYVIAHHVEAAAAAIASGIQPIFVAHTRLEEELPSYFSRRWRSTVSWAGFIGEAALIGKASRCAAVAPRLAQDLERRYGKRVDYVPVPWPLADPIGVEERHKARIRYGFGPAERIMLYMGNLDPYQGYEALLFCLYQLRASGYALYLLVATESSPNPLLRLARAHGLTPYIRVTHLRGEHQRRLLSACADVVVIPRLMDTGIPIKLLDALSRGVPVACAKSGTGGLALDRMGAVHIAEHPTTESMVTAIERALCNHPEAAQIEQNRAFITKHHSQNAFLEALCRIIPS